MRPLITPTSTRARGGEFIPRQSYTVAWTSTSGTAPAIGNGTLTGDYEIRGKVCHVNIKLSAGSTTTFGNAGTWRFSLPATAARDSVGDALVIDASPATTYIGGVLVVSGSSLLIVTTPSGNAAFNVPMTWAQSDNVTIDIEVAI
jgi:hypothetical protein